MAGALADKYSKSASFKILKGLEIPLMFFAAYSLNANSDFLLYSALLLKGCHSTLVAPVKFGMIPVLSSSENISKTNAYLQVLIIFGAIIGTFSASAISAHLWREDSLLTISPYSIFIVCGVFGFISSLFIEKLHGRSKEKLFILSSQDLLKTFRELYAYRDLFHTALALSLFWALAAMYNATIVVFGRQEMGIKDDIYISVLLVSTAIGISIGSLISAKASHGKVEIGLVPCGAFGLSLCTLLVPFYSSSYTAALLIFFLQGIFSGFFVVPLFSYFQAKSPPDKVGSFLATQNILTFSGIILLSSLVPLSTDVLQFGSPALYFFGAFLMFGVTIYLVLLMPHMILRCINWFLINLIYRISIFGKHKFPQTGGALLISNHISYLDAALIQAMIDRPVRFLMYKPIYELPVINFIAKSLGAIPIQGGNPVQVEEALSLAREAIKNGELVCIFPEGGISRIGSLQPFKTGMERIMKGLDSPIIPIYLDQLWGSVFSFKSGKVLWKVPKQIPYPLSITFGEPLPSNSPAESAFLAIEELSTEAFMNRESLSQLMHIRALMRLKRAPLRKIVIEESGMSYTRGASLLRDSLLLSKKLLQLCGSETHIALELPNDSKSMVIHLALNLAGKCIIPIPRELATSKYEKIPFKTLITSYKSDRNPSLKKHSNRDLNVITIEDLYSEISYSEKFISLIPALILPSSILSKLYGSKNILSDDTAYIFFTSGTKGDVKAVELSHKNIFSNISSINEIFTPTKNDLLLGILPFSHAFGLTMTLWFPLLTSCNVIYASLPSHSRKDIYELIESEGVSLLFLSPYFLGYLLDIDESQINQSKISSLREIFTGGDYLPHSVRRRCLEILEINPKEGYGATELSPIALLNSFNFRIGNKEQKGSKDGALGRPIPGVSAKIIDMITKDECPAGTTGLLLIKGANVMKGYYNDIEKTSEVVVDTWFNTGDLAYRDVEGFIHFIEKESRYQKMPNGKIVSFREIEEALERADSSYGRNALLVPFKNGEETRPHLFLLRKRSISEIQTCLESSDIDPLFLNEILQDEQIHFIKEFPLLSHGVIDYSSLRESLISKS